MSRSVSQHSAATASKSPTILVRALALASLALLGAGLLFAAEAPRRTGIGEKIFQHPDFEIADVTALANELGKSDASALARADLAALGLPADRGRLDTRGGRWLTLTPSQPLVPGSGIGNELRWDDLASAAPVDEVALRAAAGRAFRSYLSANAAHLRIDLGELADGRVTSYQNGRILQIYTPRVVQGVPVRGSNLTAVINHGNLVLFGANRWGDVEISTAPRVPQSAAWDTVRAYTKPFASTGSWGKTELILVPTAGDAGSQQVAVGRGYGHRLAWVVRPTFAKDLGRWEALVDAHTNELLSFDDTNQYAASQREVSGGVQPVSNDGVAPDGVEQAGWPMPFATIATPSGNVTTDSGGNLPAPVDGNITSTLAGPYTRISDNCGAISLTSAGDIDFGTSGGDDCVTPGFGGAGNTHASRTGFHELNRIIEMGRGQLPANGWLQAQLVSNMNINSNCNAFWNGSVNFYRSGGGCSNTGELAGIFDHEWGHGMDANDATPGISNPGEGIADIYTALRLNNSCIGRNFRPGIPCGGYGDPCLTCTGVRDIDYANRASGQPHTFTWANANCGGGVHCRGYVYSEAVWDLWHRDLTAAPYNMDNNTALEVTTRLTYIGAGGVGTWYAGSPPFGGCAATGGYLQYLAADDDNGNINDGTPHMAAIFAAFNRHEIACNTPAVVDSGCLNTPTTAPAVTATASDKAVQLSWSPVTNATKYQVFRTDGVFACDFGKVKIGETTGTSFSSGGLQNGRDYSYVVVPIGAGNSCMGPASACDTATPAAGPNLDIVTGSSVLSMLTGDGDPYPDNCENGRITFDVANSGLGSLTNVRIVNVTAVSHPSTTISTSFPAAVSPSTLAEGATGSGSFDFTGGGLSFGDIVVFAVEVTADELTLSETAELTAANAETDLQSVASKTWDFETDLDGWTLIQGTFNQTTTGGGANGSAGYVASSANLDNQCDQVRSPSFRLTATSTLAVHTNYDIENNSGGSWWDRANVAVLEGGVRSAVAPDGGRPYNASGAGAACVTANQGGWAAAATSWAPSSWSATALGSAGRAGQSVRFDIAYGTDVSIAGRGFWFDQVTVTDIELLVPDTQTDACSCTPTENPEVSCTDGTDNDCDGAIDCADADCAANPACIPVCNNDGTCDAGEDCTNCANDCVAGTTGGATCGNGLCEAGDGEDCLSCAIDCAGKQNGNPANRFCCGDGDGQGPVDCNDARCVTGGFSCTTVPQPSDSYCCGQNGCEPGEDSFTCALDCGAPPSCGDGTCNGSENQCSCAVDCGEPPANEVVNATCSDGFDNDCDALVDCADTADCSTDPFCSCLPRNASCTLNNQCCSGVCKNNGRCR